MNKGADIVLVKPGSQKKLYGSLSDLGLTGLEPPLWAAVLAGFLREQGYSVFLIDAEVEDCTYAELAERIAQIKPLLAAVVVSGTNPSASTMNMTGAGEIVSQIREYAPETKTLLMGLHPSALPEETLREENVDFVCQGEGFITLCELLESLRAQKPNYAIDGLWYKQDGRIVSNGRPPLMENLDDAGPPAWDMLPMERYRGHNWHCFGDVKNRQPYGILYTSFGCPFHCHFCCVNSLFGKAGIRYRGIESVMSDLDFQINTYGINNFKIIDEMFALNEKRVIELCERIIERGYDLNMWAYARINTVTPQMLEKMKQAGINWLAYGFESANPRVLEDVAKGYNPDKVSEVVNWTRQAGIYICANYIFGLPEDNYDTMNETLIQMMQINAEWANIYCAMAYPGSKLYEEALAKGWQLPASWQDYSQYGYETLPLPTKYLKGPEVLGFRDYAFDAYYQNPRYLHAMEEKFGRETALHLKKMTEHKLERKYVTI